MVLITKFQEEASYGVEPSKRTLQERFEKGFIILDKDAGPTSHQCVDYVKSIFSISKAGHSGTLDPQVTGVLLVGLGRATRLMEYMLHASKEYVCLCYFHKPISDKQIQELVSKFTGEIKQTPPIVSAVKRESRKRTIYSLEILDSQQDNQYILFRVSCQHGTYIRKLCTDMGLSLGINAQMIELRRTKSGPIDETQECVSLDYLRNLYELYNEDSSFEKYLLKCVLPMEELVTSFPKIIVKDSALESLSHGHDLALPGVTGYDDSISKDSVVAVFTQKEELVAMGRSLLSGDDFREEKGFCVIIDKVFIDEMN